MAKTTKKKAKKNAGATLANHLKNIQKDAADATQRTLDQVKDLVAEAYVRTHELKSWPSQFAATVAGLKPFEIRVNDRGFLVGERIWLREWQPLGDGDKVGRYTGRDVTLEITRIDGGFFGLRDGVVAMTVSQKLSA